MTTDEHEIKIAPKYLLIEPLEMTTIEADSLPIEIDIDVTAYTPLIPGNAAELLHTVEGYKKQFPKTVKVFSSILLAHHERHPLLEDWLILPHFQFFWSRVDEALQWFENLYTEAEQALTPLVFSQWLEETVTQTDCASTQVLCDRLYDYQLQLYGGLYLARQGLSPELINPTHSDDPSPDFCVGIPERIHILESKFVHTYEKHASFWHRFDRAVGLYGISRSPVIFCEQFKLPSSINVKALTIEHCLRIKMFTKKVYEAPNQPLIGYAGEETFAYNTSLPSCPVTIDSQRQFADAQGKGFASSYLPRILEKAATQMNSPEFSNAHKILFLGLQPGFPYLAPWTENALEISKNDFKSLAAQKNVEAVFSEDVGFSVREYI